MTPEDQIKRYTVPEFASRIRAKYPAYKDLSDNDLTDRILRKHPQYKTQVSFETRPRSQAHAEAEVARAQADAQAAANAYVSAGGKGLNPDITLGTDYFRPLSTTEKAAQKRGEPVVISSTQPQIAPAAPEMPSRPRRVTEPPVSLAPVVQGRLEAIQKQNRQREIRQKVQQARQVRERAQGLVLPKGQRNQGAAYQPKFGLGQTYREVPKIDKTVPNVAEMLAGTVAEKPLTFEQDRAIRTKTKREMERLKGRAGAASDFQGEEYQNFLRLNRTLDSPQRREEFLTLKAKQRIAEHGSIAGAILAEDEESARRQRVSEMGNLEYAAQLPKGPLLGVASGAGTALKGLAVASRKIVDQITDTKGFDTRDAYVYQLGEAIEKNSRALLRSNPDLEQEFFVGKAPEALGQSALFLLGGWASKSPKLAISILGGTMTAGDAYEEVRALGGSDEEAVNAGLLAGAILGPTELIGTRGLVKALEGKVQGAALKTALKTALATGSKEGIENAVQEIGQEAGQGLITGNPRSLAELAEAGALGGIAGFVGTGTTTLGAGGIDALRNRGQNIVSDYLAASPLSTPEEKAAVEQVSAPDQKPDVDTKKLNVLEPAVEKPQQIAPDQSAVVESPKAGYKITKESVIAPETSQNAPISEVTGEKRYIPVPPEVSLPVPTVETPAEVKTQPSATESQLTTERKVTDEVGAEELGRVPAPDYKGEKVYHGTLNEFSDFDPRFFNTRSKGAAGSRDAFFFTRDRGSAEAYAYDLPSNKEGRVLEATLDVKNPLRLTKSPTAAEISRAKTDGYDSIVTPYEVAVFSPEQIHQGVKKSAESIAKEPSQLNKQLSDWGGRLKGIAQTKDLNALQSLSDEMAAHQDDPQVARLRTAIRDELARARQPEMAEQKAAYNISEEVPAPQKLSQKAAKLRSQAESAEGKTVRAAPTHRVGAPKPDASRNSLEQQVRAYGGVKDDVSAAYAGEIKWLKESSTRGTVNQTGGASVEEMATKLAQDGYGKGVWWEGAPNNVDPQKFLQAVMDDTRGTKQYSTERDVIEDDPDVKAWDALAEGAGVELIERVSSGRATAADIVTLTREAQANGLSDQALDAFIGGLQDAVSEALPKSTETGEGYTLDKDGTLLDTDGSPLFARQLPLTSDELIQEQSRPKETDQRERLRREQSEREEAADPLRAAALRTLAELKRRGLSVDEYARQGDLFGPGPSAEEIKLLKEVERGTATSAVEQSSMFASGKIDKSETRFEVKGNQVSLGPEGAQIITDVHRELGLIERFSSGIRGVFERKGDALARNLDILAKRGRKGAKELAVAVRQAAKAGNNKIVLFYGESARRHEMFHEASDRADKLLRDRHGNLAGLVTAEQWPIMRASLVGMGYPEGNLSVLTEEAAAYIAEGRYEELGLTREQAVDWMTKWFDSFSKQNPHVTPRQFQEMSDEATQARDEVYRTESALREPLPNEALPGVQERRESGDRESIAAAREPRDITQTEAFRRWFGDSKVVDEDGKPLVVYHATLGDFSEFSGTAETQHDEGYYGKGFYFAPQPGMAEIYSRAVGAQIMPVYLSVQNPYVMLPNEAREVEENYEVEGPKLRARVQAAGHDGIFVQRYDESDPEPDEIVVFRPTQIKSATGNRGTFDPNDPNILMARSGDPWSNLTELSDEFEQLANEPELAPGEKPRSLPQTLDAAGLESGPTKGYLPESIVDDGLERANQVISEKGIDGAMEFVRSGDGIEWASTGYEVSARLREQEAIARKEGKSEDADAIRDKRLSFLDDFAMGAVERGRSIVGIKAISMFAPDRMALSLNKASRKHRKRSISPEEESKITKLGEELGLLEERNRELERRLAEATARAKKRTGRDAKPKKTDYQSQLEQQAATVLRTLKPKLGKLDLSDLSPTAKVKAFVKEEEGSFDTTKLPTFKQSLPGDAELIAQYGAAQLQKFATVEELNQHLVQEFGQDIEQHLPKIRQRAYAIRSQARQAEIEASETEPKRRKTILSEIQKEISESLTAIREAQKAQDRAAKEEKAAQVKEAQAEAKTASQAEKQRLKEVADMARHRLRAVKARQKAAEQSEIDQIREELRAAEKAQAEAERAEDRTTRAAARLEARRARERATEEKKEVIKEARRRLKQQRIEYKQAAQAETKGYRESIKTQRDAERKAELWDTPLRNAANDARERLKDATDANDPQTADDLIAVAAEKFLPTETGGNPRTGAVDPARVYKDLKDEFPALVTRKNQGDLYKKGYQRIQDATAAAREAARMRSASAESKRLWDELGIDVDAQAVLIQQAEVRRQTDELRRKAQAEFQRVSKTFIEKLWTELGAFPRALQSSIDAPIGRQGAFFLLTHPLETIKTAVPATLKGYGSIHVVDYIAREKELAKHPDYKLAVDSGLELSQTASSGDPALVAEEQHQSPLASRIFPHVRLSEQGYVLGMNAQRLAMFARLADIGRADGYTPESNPEFFESVAHFVNDGTGRGNMPDFVKRASTLLNFFFFSTRLNISRLQLLNDLFNPIGFVPERANVLNAAPGFASYDPVMRKVVAKELVRLGMSVGTVLLLASALGVKIEYDLDDPDALLLRVRNTRYDITGGEAGTIKFLYRFMKSIYRTAAGEDLEPFQEPLAILSKFMRYKLAPLPSGTIDAITGKDAVGQPANLKKFESTKQVMQENVIIKRTLPMLTGNILDTVTEEGWIGIPMVLPAVAGFGVSSYPDRGLRAIKNQAVVDLLESLKITSNSLLGQKTKDEALDKEIQSRIMAKVETLEIPQGATEVGKEKIVKERLAQIRSLARAEAAIAQPKLYAEYLSKEGSESVSVLTDEEKKTLTEQDLTNYRSRYAQAYVEMLGRASEAPNWSKLTDDEKEKVLARIPRIAHNRAKIDLVKTKRKGTP